MDAEIALDKLLLIINAREESLQSYASQETAKQSYIDIENKLICELTDIYNELNQLQFLSIWENLESEISALSLLDPQVGSVQIIIPVSCNGNKMALINLNSFVNHERI
jgi:hypothetical protein